MRCVRIVEDLEWIAIAVNLATIVAPGRSSTMCTVLAFVDFALQWWKTLLLRIHLIALCQRYRRYLGFEQLVWCAGFFKLENCVCKKNDFLRGTIW